MPNLLKSFKFFTIADYEKEEAYLSQMSKKGYQLKAVQFPGIYTFEKADAEPYAYRLYLRDAKKEDFDSYIQLFTDSGWEYVTEFATFSYFKKPLSDSNTELFSDNQSRLDMVKAIFYSRMLPILVIFTVIIVPNTNLLFQRVHFGGSGVINVLSLFLLALYLLYVIIIIYCGFGLYRLSKRYTKQ